MVYITRYIEKIVSNVSESFKVLYLGGPRQVGKTTVLQHIAEHQNRAYVSLDNPQQRQLAQQDPELFLDRYPTPVLIDEVQYAPQLFPYIKIRVDQNPTPGQYWLTGSQQFAVMKQVQESLVGRVGILHLLGLSSAELHRTVASTEPFIPQSVSVSPSTLTKETDVFQRIYRGSFPALVQDQAMGSEIFYSSYLQTYIDRDLTALFGVTKVREFHTFLQLCAARTGQLLNYSDLARDAGISVHAARSWISILEGTMQIYLLQPYYKNISKRLIKAPKLYFLDTGFAAYLTKWNSAATLAAGAMAGAFFETHVVAELVKSYLFRGEQPPLYYFRDKELHEVDILIERNQQLYPIEIKRAVTIHSNDAKGLNYLRKTSALPVQIGGIVCLSPSVLPLDQHNTILPVGVIQ